jgi:hypothetical protein
VAHALSLMSHDCQLLLMRLIKTNKAQELQRPKACTLHRLHIE